MIVAASLLLLAQTAKVYEPKFGSKERKLIADGLRKAVTPSLKQPVVFKIDWIRSNGTYAFLDGKPQRPDGRPLSYAKTVYAEAIREGMFGGGINALMKRTKGKWSPVEWTIGATDVNWDGMWKRRKLPRALFPTYGG